MHFDSELTLLSEQEVWGIMGGRKLDVLAKYGNISAITDLVILTGGNCDETCSYMAPDDDSLKGRAGWNYTRTSDGDGDVVGVDYNGNWRVWYRYIRQNAVRPVLRSSFIFSQISPNRVMGYNGTEEVEYGEYPQYAPDDSVQIRLEKEYRSGKLRQTGRNYTFDKTEYNDYFQYFQPVTYEEYEYDGKKYIRVRANSDHRRDSFKLSNGEYYENGDYVWVEVSPVKWLIDDETQTLVSKRGLLAGIRFYPKNKKYNGDFSTTDMKEYLDKYMLRDLFQDATLTCVENMTPMEQEQIEKPNPYGLSFEQISEEETIKGTVLSDIPVFLHGRSSEGKSARVKQLDPNCVILYLRNATPDSLNGKSVYDQQSGKMIDIKPTWLVKLEERCQDEPDKLHILFLDELTNALPSIQGMAFNIVLDREVNGLWKLPSNARIVAAGNELNDSLAANELAEPLFNRFAHVYIETTVDNWLDWAIENNIHPLIYAYIAYRKDRALRTKYDGIKPNADPRKWEMASKMLYETKNPYMLKSLIGEELTKEFAEFCSYNFITLEDVLNDNYDENSLNKLNISKKHATVSLMMQVDEKNFRKVRDFVAKLGNEYLAMFEGRWANTLERLEIIQEIRLEKQEKQLTLQTN